MDNIRKNFSIKRTRDIFCMYHERFAFFSEFGNDSFTSKIVLDEYSSLLNTLKKFRYMKYRKDLNQELAFVVKEILKCPGLKMRLRPVKLLLFLCLNVLGDVLHLKKFPLEI